MRRTITFALGVFLLVMNVAALSACGGAGSASPAPTRTPTSRPVQAVTPTLALATPSPPPPTATPGPTSTPTPFVMPVPPSGWRADGSRSVIALTFDANADTGYASAILDLLEYYDVKATVAVTGQWVAGNHSLLQRIVRDGDTVMNHSWDHPDFTTLTRDQRLSELERTDTLVQEVAGVSTKPFFRPPYGAFNDAVRADAASAGYGIILWNIDPQGWSGKPAELIEANVYENARDRGIALFHLDAYGDYQALGPIIETLRDAGYRFVTMAELLGVPTPTPTRAPATATPTRTPRPQATDTPRPTSTWTPRPPASQTPEPTPGATVTSTGP